MYLFIKKVLLYALVLWMLNMGIGYFLSTYEEKDLHAEGQFYPKLRWNDYYQQKNNIDILILGSSHAFRSFDPAIIQNELGDGSHVFNLGSSGQNAVTSYHVLQEVLSQHQPKLVVLDLYFMAMTYDKQLNVGRLNLQEMRAGSDKSDFFWNGFSLSEKILLQLFPAFVYKDYLKEKINILAGRMNIPIKGVYRGNGFVSSTDTLSLDELMNQNQFSFYKLDSTAITKKNLDYLEKIKSLCDQKEVNLIFIGSPMPVITVEKVDHYSHYFQIFDAHSKKLQVPFYDYNMDRTSIAISDANHYFDEDHLNAAGARVFSKAISKMLKPLN